MVISPGMWENSLLWIEREKNLLNVAVSRARSSLVVLGHPLVSKFGGPTLSSLREYLRKSHQNNTLHSTFRTDSHAEKLLLDAMQMRRLSPLTKLDVEGYELDFALSNDSMKLNIEVDGDQHLDERAKQKRVDITRDRILRKLGWEVVRIPAWMCYTDVDDAIDKIVAMYSRESVHGLTSSRV
jgi:very-short-patch-repair endonuclease